MNFLLLLTSFTLTSAPAAPVAPTAPTDSVGTETRGGQRFVRHRVTKGESLYGLARRYRVRTEQIEAANAGLAGGLKLGQVVLVPRGAAKAGTGASEAAAKATGPRPTPAANVATAAAAPAPAVATPAAPAVPARYTVAAGETVFGIARRFHLTSAELIRLNRLPPSGAVRVGQELLLLPGPEAAPAAASTATATATASTANTAPALPARPVAAARPAEPASVPPLAPGKVPVPTPVPTPAPTPGTAPVPTPVPAEPVATVTPATSPVERRDEREAREKAPTRASEVIGRVTESGLAATIDKSGTDKYLALHKTAPIGMIMQVKNTMNGQSVYVRVIGRLPDTGENNNVLVRLSPRAVQKLGTPDARFRVETSYVP